MSIWRKLPNWTYEYLERDVEPEALPGFEDLVRLWKEKRGGRPVPAWSDYDFSDLKGWHSKIAMYEISYDPFDYTCKLSGTEFDWLYDRNMTGIMGSDLSSLRVENPETMEFYEMACRQMYITRTTGGLNLKGREHVQITFVEFPLSGGGDKATHTLEAFSCPNANWSWLVDD